MMALEYGISASEELKVLGQIEGRAFAFPVADAAKWFADAGEENLRVVRHDGQVGACAVMVPMGQFFGGRSLRMIGYAGVVVRETFRRKGLARHLMRESLAEYRRAGFAVSALYPTTATLYRSVGFAYAGHAGYATIPLNRLRIASYELDVREAKEEDDLQSLYRTFAQSQDGMLDRGPYIWKRIGRERGGYHAWTWVVHHDEKIEGYFTLRASKAKSGAAYLLQDVVCTTGRAARRILTFFADQSTTYRSVKVMMMPWHPLLLSMPHPCADFGEVEPWMLRLLDVRVALTARGYPPGLNTRLALDVHDDVLSENNGKYTLIIEDGNGIVEEGGAGTVQLDVRSLATLFTGYASPYALRAAGRLDVQADVLPQLQTIFAGPAPYMVDHF